MRKYVLVNYPWGLRIDTFDSYVYNYGEVKHDKIIPLIYSDSLEVLRKAMTDFIKEGRRVA